MNPSAQPSRRPERPWFSSGPTAKRPGWSPDALAGALVGRGIRAPSSLARVQQSVDLTREVLGIPDDYRVALIPGSDTGAVEAALWNLLGERPVQVLDFENFGHTWAEDVVKHLKIDAEVLKAPYGQAPDLSKVRPDADLVFPWNGTTSGVRMPGPDFIAADRSGLTICDATSAAFAMDLPWDRLDVTTFSFQKALGGEAGIGFMVLSPRAVERLNTFDPGRSIPKVLRLRKDGRADEAIFDGALINTFSLLTVEDWLDGLRWAARVGGVPELIRRTQSNFEILSDWVARTPWIDFLASDPAIRSETSVCLQFVDPRVTGLDAEGRTAFVKRFCSALEREGVALDIAGHRSAPPGLRVWCGCTVEAADVEALTPWLDWAFAASMVEPQPA
ncbi:phosphoserine transaminase [Caulobacter sp. 17J80-11]|uniref:phosphoserine transaminase n=1 Tax=Caulobacter sp. 17J80-11 TaxID=2763502 RepID=UPI001653AF52|nr:phosphoserine transaminase [Caulobacter sp. 17J80-11]MBC6980315.1 phosphoserine transaminase [Caulobacter sp. 17J80-11]